MGLSTVCTAFAFRYIVQAAGLPMNYVQAPHKIAYVFVQPQWTEHLMIVADRIRLHYSTYLLSSHRGVFLFREAHLKVSF